MQVRSLYSRVHWFAIIVHHMVCSYLLHCKVPTCHRWLRFMNTVMPHCPNTSLLVKALPFVLIQTLVPNWAGIRTDISLPPWYCYSVSCTHTNSIVGEQLFRLPFTSPNQWYRYKCGSLVWLDAMKSQAGGREGDVLRQVSRLLTNSALSPDITPATCRPTHIVSCCLETTGTHSHFRPNSNTDAAGVHAGPSWLREPGYGLS